jgi:hypothetical protein
VVVKTEVPEQFDMQLQVERNGHESSYEVVLAVYLLMIMHFKSDT